MAAEPALLEVEALTKQFSGSTVLDRVSFALGAGEVLGVIGENGAGKSTLMKILAGLYQPSAGALRLAGQAVQVRSPAAAKRLGIAMVPQELNLVESLSVAENVFLGSERTRHGLLDRAGMRAATQAMLQELGVAISADSAVRGLSVAQQQMVEVAKALVHQSRVLILDEPTTVLNGAEAEVLFRVLRRLRDRGVGLLFVSHKLAEVKALGNRVLILRDGARVGLAPTADLSVEEMARGMVGRELSQVFPPKRAAAGPVVLSVRGLRLPGVLDDVDLDLRAGEVLGLAGLVGAGRTELAETLMGLRRRAAGQIKVGGVEVDLRSPRQAVALGLAYLSEDRQGRGLLPGFGVPANITLICLARYARLLIDRRREREAAAGYVERFGVRAARLEGAVRYLSGGNQQKVYLAKWLDTQPRILILDEPTRGIDVNAKVEIYRLIRSLADQGMACLVISSELEEVIGLCQRVAVMRGGRLTGVLTGDQLTEEEIMYYATGVKGGRAA